MRKVFFCLMLWLMCVVPVYGGGKAPELKMSAQMGAAYATIDVKIDLRDKAYPSIYYLAVARGSECLRKEPDAEMIMAYADGTLTEGIECGHVVRGHWIASLQYNRRVFSLSGGENVRKIEGLPETGFVDGLRYNIYMVAVTGLGPDKLYSNIAVAEGVMAMPFGGMAGSRTFTIGAMDKGPAGRQLANIQGLAELYRETGGLHGSIDFLAYNYVLTSDINLRGHDNWIPLGSGAYAFCGTFDGQGHTVRNLKSSAKSETLGLFGTLDGAEVSNLRLESFNLYVNESSSWQETIRMGALAGKAINSSIENIQVENSQISGGISSGGIVGEIRGGGVMDSCRFSGKVSGYGHVGGLIGTGYSDEDQGIIIKNSISQGTVSAFIFKGNGDEAALGGFAGLLKNCVVSDCLSVGTPIISTIAGRDTGGFVGRAENSVFKGCRALRDVEGKYRVGGFAGLLAKEAMLVECYSSGDVKGDRVAGAFVGAAYGNELSENARHYIKFISCHSSGSIMVKNGMAGGFAGSMSYSAADACSSSGNVAASGFEIGGFVGRLSHKSRITNSCAYGDVENKGGEELFQHKPEGRQAGGFAGMLTHGSGIEYSFSAGNVRGFYDVGGFAGVIAASGAPNTLYGCISFAKWVSSEGNEGINRLVGRMDHEGVNNCYSYLGTVVAAGDGLRHVFPNAFGPDGGDINDQSLEGILSRLAWDRRYWTYDEGLLERMPEEDVRKPRLNSLHNF